MSTEIHSLEEFRAEAERFAKMLRPHGDGATILALSGELGAGKTTFVQALAGTFGIEEEVNSPTFVIEKIYAMSQGPFARLIHIDAYRLTGAPELEALGWHDIARDSANVICIEWPEHVAGLVPPEAIRVTLTFVDDERRGIAYEHGGTSSSQSY